MAFDDDQRHALSGHLDGVRVAELVRREASPYAGLARDASQLQRAAVADQGAAGRGISATAGG
jgi:hypothetical protein